MAAHQAGLVTLRQCVERGLSRAQFRRLRQVDTLTSVVSSVYRLAGVLATPASRSAALDLRRRRTAVLGLLAYGPRAVATGLAALVLAGVRGVPIDLMPEVTMRGMISRRQVPGVRLRRIPVREVITPDGFPAVTPECALAQAVPEVDRMTAIALMDSALSLKLLGIHGLARAHDLARDHRGVARTHRWWSEADGRAQSPAETFARLSLSDAGCRPDVLQLVVLGARGRFLACVEFAWRLPDGRWLLVEVDGIDIHGTPTSVIADLHRQNPLITAETLLRRYTGTDAMNGRLAREVVAVLRRVGWRAGAPVPPGPLVLTDLAQAGPTSATNDAGLAASGP